MHAYQYITNHYVITQIYVLLLTAQIRYEHHVITLRAITSLYTLCVTCKNIRYEYALTFQRIDVSSEHALSVGEKARENMTKWPLCHCFGSLHSIQSWPLMERAESR